MSVALNNTKNRNQALLITVVFHATLILLLFILKVSQPDPPLTASEGMVVNLGYVDESTGNIQPISDESEIKPIITHEQIKANQVENEKILTQSIEETQAIKTSEKVSEKIKDTNSPDNTNETNNEPQPQVNPAALYKGKKNNSTSQGTSNKGTGDQGDPNGDPFSNNYGKNTGTGNGNSVGNGTGGNGISHTLLNRRAENLMKPEYECNESGTVIVEIWVDQTGKVIKAKAGIKGSTTTSTCLYTKAENAAYKTRFNANPNAPEEQRGTIVYNFSLK